MWRFGMMRPPRPRVLMLALTAGVIGIAGSSRPAMAQEATRFDFESRYPPERPLPVFARPQHQFGSALTSNSDRWAAESRPSLFDPTPLGSLDAPSARLHPTATATATSSEPVSGARSDAMVAGGAKPAATELRRVEQTGAVGPASRRERPLGRGLAAWYQHPGRTASGEIYNPDGLTAAHRTLPFGTRVRVVNPRNGRAVVVRINDRSAGPRTRTIELSRGAARQLGIKGVGMIEMSVLSGPEEARTPVAQSSR
jgi:rare lipoprotein A